MDKVIVIQGNKTVDLEVDYKGVLHESEIITLYESMKEFEPRLNTGLRQTLNRLIAHSDEQAPPLSYENVKSYLLSINEQLEAGDSGKRVYRANLKKFFTSINFGDEITHLVSERKGRKRKFEATPSERVPLGNTERRTSSYKAKHKSRGLSSEQAQLPSESNVSKLHPLILKLKNSNNKLVTIDLREYFDSPFISDSELQKYAKHIHDSSLRDASKVTYLGALKQLIQYNNEVRKRPEFYNKESFQSFIASLYDEMTKGAKIKPESIERKQAYLSAGFELIGLPKILRADRFKLKTGGNDLQTDNYDDTSWIATIRALIPEHQRLYKQVCNNTMSYEQDFNDFISCSCLLLTVYTAMTFAELNSLVYEEFDTEYSKLGSKDFVFNAIKYRSSKSNDYNSFVARRSSKTLVVRLMEVIEQAKKKFGIQSQQVLFYLHGSEATEISSHDVGLFATKLVKRNRILQGLLKKRSKYKLNLQRLRSSVIHRISSQRGEASGVIAGRHRLSVHRGYNYSKVSNETAHKEMTQTAHALEKHARGIKISIAVEKGKNLYNPQIIDEKEKQESGVADLKNGGTCKGLETAESKEFQKSLDRNPLLSDEDKKLMGCGFIIKCFGCANFAVVDEVNDIWKLLSFESILNDSINYHVSFAHFIEKQGELKAKLQIIKGKLTPKKLATAIKKLDKQGLHPLWDGMYAVLDKMDI
ncbi:hypothetical protein OL313_002332 [Vibrio parahaemolyticus]|nr:hypothetical protein [Vibrio parahaemolyticus]EJG0890023.1 hypothetical protein [Vibrio parahaemolyticus]EKA7387431.1 hypothetical protein [Vibrio parahaemolyticus]ELA9318749.1 hypothetical protein [Vibrio parahaemolyticus]